MTVDELTRLLARLSALRPSQFEAVLLRASLPIAHLPGLAAPQATRAIEAIRYVKERNGLVSFSQIVEDVAGTEAAARPELGLVKLPADPPAALSNILIRIPSVFVGRDELLAAIVAELDARSTQLAIVALHGLMGVGKSTLAAVHAHHRRTAYRISWWIRAQSESLIRSDLAALGVRAGWVAADSGEADAFTEVMRRLHHAGADVLLVYDNASDADALRPYLPVSGASRVLITSNSHAWRSLARTFELSVWPARTGGEFLRGRSGRADPAEAAEALSRLLGGLPLAHEQAAAYCEHLEIDLVDYHRRFAARPQDLLDDRQHAPAEYNDKRTVARTFTLAIEQAAKLHPAADILISYAALLPPELIPLLVFGEATARLDELAAVLRDGGIESAVAALRTFALIDREMVADERDPAVKTEAIRLHRLVREVVLARSPEEHLARREAALVDALGQLYTAQTAWSRARRLDGLAAFLLDKRTAPPADDTAQAASLHRSMAAYRLEALASRYAEAEHHLRRALAYNERVLGHLHATTLQTLHDLAFCIRAKGDLPAAIACYREVIELRRQALGPDDERTLESMNHLAFCLQRTGDLGGAEQLIRQVIAAQDGKPETSDTLIVLRNLALLLQTKGTLQAAEAMYRRVYAGQLRILGMRHGLTIETVIDLAHCLRLQKQHVSAKQLYQLAMEQAEPLFGPDHTITRSAHDGLAMLPVS